MSLRIVEHHVVYKNPRYYCGPGPAVVIDASGNLTVAFRRVPSWLEFGFSGHWHPATELCLTRSSDGGRSWSPPQVFLGGYQCPCLTRLRDGTLVHSTHRKELVPEAIADACRQALDVGDKPWPGIHRGTAIWRSEDEGVTWGEPVYLDGVPGLEPLHHTSEGGKKYWHQQGARHRTTHSLDSVFGSLPLPVVVETGSRPESLSQSIDHLGRSQIREHSRCVGGFPAPGQDSGRLGFKGENFAIRGSQ